MIKKLNVDIVVLDDDPECMRFTKGMLLENGFKDVVCVSPGSVAIHQLQMLNPKMIISDISDYKCIKAIIDHFGHKVIVNDDLKNDNTYQNLKKNAYFVAFKGFPDKLITTIRNLWRQLEEKNCG